MLVFPVVSDLLRFLDPGLTLSTLAAGGYDAIWVLALAPPVSSTAAAPEVAVEKLLRSYTDMSVRPLSRHAWVQGGQAQVETGLLKEELETVEGLRRVVGGF